MAGRDFWLRCDNCRRSLDVRADEPMQLVMAFKPSLFPWPIPKTHPQEHRHRCRNCGFVTVLIPAGQSAGAEHGVDHAPLDDSWRAITVKS